MPFCSNCGRSNGANARYCKDCGQPLSPSAPIVGGLTGRLAAASVVAGRYRVERKLGQGGMGAVYLASDVRLGGKQVALKEMSEQGIVDPAERQAAVVAFAQEAQMLAGLEHPNLPKVTDYFEESGNQYLVMEYVTGETLEKRLERAGGPLAEPLVRKVAEQLCDVLEYLHRQQPPIIFRDLKPANIMLQADEKVKLIDFGIARHFKPGKRQDTQAMGTPGYAAPEQYGKGQSDQRTDIYALGAVLHHMLTGRNPAQDPFQFPAPRTLNGVLSASIEKIVVQAVELEPGRRWQTVREMRNMLMGATGQATFVSTYPSPAQPGSQSVAARMATQAALPPSPLPQTALVRPPAPIVGPVTGAGQPVRVPPPPYVQPPVLHVPYMQVLPAGLLGKQLASYSRRVVAYLIDIFMMMLLYTLLAAVTTALLLSGSSAGAGLGVLSLLVLLLSSWAYLIWPTATSGQTLGKKLLGIQVVDDSGGPPGWGKAFVRYLIGFFVESLFFYIGLIWPLFDAKKQTWHDKIASTYVVQT